MSLQFNQEIVELGRSSARQRPRNAHREKFSVRTVRQTNALGSAKIKNITITTTTTTTTLNLTLTRRQFRHQTEECRLDRDLEITFACTNPSREVSLSLFPPVEKSNHKTKHPNLPKRWRRFPYVLATQAPEELSARHQPKREWRGCCRRPAHPPRNIDPHTATVNYIQEQNTKFAHLVHFKWLGNVWR